MPNLSQLQTERKRLLIVLAVERDSQYPDKDARIAQYQAQLAAVNEKLSALQGENGGAA